jgi:hypothetical protein
MSSSKSDYTEDYDDDYDYSEVPFNLLESHRAGCEYRHHVLSITRADQFQLQASSDSGSEAKPQAAASEDQHATLELCTSVDERVVHMSGSSNTPSLMDSQKAAINCRRY